MDGKSQIKNQHKKRPSIRKILGISLLGVCALLPLIFVLVTKPLVIAGSSMMPTLLDEQSIFVNKVAYWLDEPERGEIVAVRYPTDPRHTLITRIVAFPNDLVEVRDGQLFINDKLVDEPYVKESINDSGNWTVPVGEVFVLGDNRNNSADSRTFGGVPIELIIGRVWLVYAPIDQIQRISHTFDRDRH